MEQRVDLCLASTHYYPVYSGPAMRFRRYAPGLRDRGVYMRVFTATPHESNPTMDVPGTHSAQEKVLFKKTLLPVEYVDGIPVQRVQMPLDSKLWNYLGTTFIYHNTLTDYCLQRDNRPDVIQFLSLPIWSLPWLIRLRCTHIPLVFTHTLLGQMSARPWKRRLQRLYWRLPFQLMDCVVVSSGVMRDALRDIGVTTRIEVIPNGVDLKRFRPVASPHMRNTLRRQLGLDPTAELILFVGPIVPRKGVDALVEAWSLLGRKRPRAHLVLVGPRSDEIRPSLSDFRAKIKALLASSGAQDRVTFTGPVNNVEAYFQAADVFVFPSRREGMPNVVPEAFGCGVPSVLTPFIGLPDEFGRPGEHYVLVERTPEALAMSIAAMLDDPERRQQLGRRARKWVEAQMDVEKSLDRYASLYHELVDRAGEGRV